MQTENATKIATLNDRFRFRGDGVTLTQGVQGVEDLYGLLEAVRWYDNFNEGNDPYSEHDFGSFEWKGEKIFWKIDYYDVTYRYFCDPLSLECHRLMTVMLASEY